MNRRAFISALLAIPAVGLVVKKTSQWMGVDLAAPAEEATVITRFDEVNRITLQYVLPRMISPIYSRKEIIASHLRESVEQGIAESEAEYQRGEFFGPFEKHEDFISALHKESGVVDS